LSVIIIPPTVPAGLEGIIATYGDPKFNGRAVDKSWEAESMVGCYDRNADPSKRGPRLPLIWKPLYVHKLIVGPLAAALGMCADLNDGYRLLSIGCFAPRYKRSQPGEISVHSWGIAVDINADTNKAIADCLPSDSRRASGSGAFDLPAAWVDCFKRAGWIWGGDFKGGYFDPMHFQLCAGY
jgi:hypothetical protein